MFIGYLLLGWYMGKESNSTDRDSKAQSWFQIILIMFDNSILWLWNNNGWVWIKKLTTLFVNAFSSCWLIVHENLDRVLCLIRILNLGTYFAKVKEATWQSWYNLRLIILNLRNCDISSFKQRKPQVNDIPSGKQDQLN